MIALNLRSARWTWFFSILLTFGFISSTAAVHHENWKTCDQSGFCKRNRAYADNVSAAGPSWTSPYRLLPESIRFEQGQLQGIVIKTLEDNEEIRLPLAISFLESGVARFTIDEEKRMKGEMELRHGSKANKGRYNDLEKWVIVGGLELSTSAKLVEDTDSGITKVVYGPGDSFEAIITQSPLSVDFKRDGKTHVKFNDKGLLNIEHWRAKNENKTEEGDDTWWDEYFGGNTDSKPRGPESVALDITFPGYSFVYGIPEHADSMSLKETRGGEGHHTDPYRLYNSDVFEYELNSPMTLYGSIPFMQAHKKGSTVGVFWLNAAETWIDITKETSHANPLSLGVTDQTSIQSHWISESGLLDVFVFLGPSPQDISKNYGELTGYTQLPQLFSIGYHQCRWNYMTDEDVKDVDRKFDMYEIPYDVIWLDLEYLDDKKYFTWDPMSFPDYHGMQNQLDDSERKLVIIIDPHIKNYDGYTIHDQLKNKDLAIKNKDSEDYQGWCWPGSSIWLDSMNPAGHDWWASLFPYDKYPGCHHNCFIWNDMNEPSVFNGPETTSPKDNIHFGGWENRDIHNVLGLTFVNATFDGLLERKKGEIRRPFILTRSFYAGLQRQGAMWTGDNQAKWEYLGAALPMILNNGISGFPFAGADVGGFFGNPSKELLTRWYQNGIWYPFFRAHAHIDTRRREPYLIGAPYTHIIAEAIRLRYQLLPAWYTAFYEASINGTPIVRPQWFVFPNDEAGFAIDDQLYLGSTGLLAKPVVQEGASNADIYISDDEKYYDYFDYTVYEGAGKAHTVDAPLEKIPLLIQGGHIIPRKDRPRRSSGLMKHDPFTLVISLGKAGTAEGTVYVDDGETYDYLEGAQIHRRFSFVNSVLFSTDIGLHGSKTASYLKTMAGIRVERVIFIGAPSEWAEKSHVLVSTGASDAPTEAGFKWVEGEGKKASYAVVKDPHVSIGEDWNIQF